MSAEAMTWALRQNVGSPRAKLVLVLLAYRAGADNTCVVGYDQLSDEAEVTVRGVRAALGQLWTEALLERVAGPRYRLLVVDEDSR